MKEAAGQLIIQKWIVTTKRYKRYFRLRRNLYQSLCDPRSRHKLLSAF